MLESIASWVQDVIVQVGYPGIFLLMILEAVAPPIPSEIILPFAGFLASKGELNLYLVIAVGTVGNLAAAWLLYFVGLKGDEWVRTVIRRWGRFVLVGERDLDNIERYYRRHGDSITFFSRMIPGVRTLISLPAGMSRLNFWRFTAFTLAGSLLWATLLSVVGYWLGENWEDISSVVDRLSKLIVAAIVLGIVAFIVYRLRSKPGRAQAGD